MTEDADGYAASMSNPLQTYRFTRLYIQNEPYQRTCMRKLLQRLEGMGKIVSGKDPQPYGTMTYSRSDGAGQGAISASATGESVGEAKTNRLSGQEGAPWIGVFGDANDNVWLREWDEFQEAEPLDAQEVYSMVLNGELDWGDIPEEYEKIRAMNG